MNSLFLILSTLVIYFFGYRYFARFLQKTVFRLPSASTPPGAAAEVSHGQSAGISGGPSVSIAKRLQNAGSGRHEMLGFHFATITTLTTVSGASIAVYWGWVPAYLWLLVGSSVAAGSFAIGGLWLRRKSMESDSDTGIGTGLIPAVASNFHSRLAPMVLLVLVLALTVFGGLFVYLAAILLASFPSAAWPLLVILVLVGLLSRVIANQRATLGSRGMTYLVALVFILLSIWIGQGNTLGFSGSLNFDLSGTSLLSVDGITIWGILILLFALFVQRKPFEDWQKNLGVLTAILTVILLLVFYIGIAIDHPAMSAPAFAGGKSPGVFPWLLITLTSGAYAGLHFLFAYSVTAPRLQSETDSIYVGYGATLLEGLFALSVILVFGSLLGNKEVWAGLYESWAALPDGAAMLGHYVNGVIYASDQLGLGHGFSETWTALVLICLSLVTSVALLRVLRVYLQELGVRFGYEKLGAVKTGSWAAFGLLFLVLVAVNASTSIKSLELVLAPGQYLLASIGLVLITGTLAQRQLPVVAARVLLGLTLALGLLGYIALVLAWYSDFSTAGFLVSLILTLLQLALIVGTGLKLLKKRAPISNPGSPEPPEN